MRSAEQFKILSGALAVRLSRLKIVLAALDPLRVAGMVLFVVVWQVLTLGLPAIILPTPLGVVKRLLSDFLSAPALSYYGVSEANLYGNLIYTTENVAIAVTIGSAIGILAGLLSARFGLIRAIIDPVMMTAGTVPIKAAVMPDSNSPN